MNRYHLVHRLGFLRRRPRRLRCVGKVFALALLSLPTAADESIRFHHYGARDGLSGEPVYAVLQDREGYVWVGSDGGLDRFDGHRFESFRRTGSQSRHLPADRVLSLAEDSMGRVWAGTNAGPAIYSRELKSFRLLSLPLRADAAGTLPEASVEALFVDRRQTLWIGTDRGLFRLPLTDEPPRGDQIRRGFDGLIAGDPEPPDPRINAFAEDADGRLWIGTRAGLLRISSLDSDPRLDHFVHDPADPQSLHDDEIYALLTDHRGALWIGAWGTGGLGRLDADQLAARRPRFRRFVYPPGDPRGLPLDVVKSLREARDHTLWIGTQEVGQCRLTAEERLRAEPRFHCLAYDPLDPTSAPRSPVGAILQDKQGTLWFGGIGGLARHVPATAKVALVHPRPEPGASARSIQITGVVESRNGPVWVGTGEGLVRLAASDRPGGGFESRRLVHEPGDPQSLASDWIYILLEDRRRRLWVGTVRGGLHLLVDDGPEPRFRRFPTGDSGLTNSSVFSLFEDRSGTLWVGTYLGLFSGASDVAATSGAPAPVFRRLEPAAGALTSELIYWVEEDPQGRLWIGTAAGLDRLSADRTVVESNLLKPGMVPLQMVSGPDGKLWMATGTDGLISVDPMSEKWRRWAPDLGMGVGAMGTSFDALGRLWVTGKRHLRRLDLDTGEVRVFDDGDGLRVLPFQQQAFHRGPSGRFFVGGTNGLAVFYPEELSHPPLLAPVVLRGLSIANEAVAVDPEGPLVRSIETLDVLTLPPDVPTFSIEFAALTYHRQETVRYAHRLRGYSDAWIESGPDRRRATFTNLSPGEYTFEVKARGDVGPWAPETASLRVRILPEWHEVFWVRGLALLLAVGLPLVWLGHRYRRVEKHRRELQALVDRWQMERRQRRRWQHLSVDAAQLAQQIRGPLEQILHRARAVSTGEVEAESGRTLADQLLDPAQEATTKLEALVSFVVESPSDIHPVDLGELLDAALLAAADEMQAAGLIVRHRLRGTRVHADRDVLETLLREVLRLAVEGAGPGDALLFAFDREGAFGRLKIEGLIGPGAPARGRDPGPRAALEAVEELAARLEWTLDVETAGDESTRVDLSGLRPVS